MLWIGIGWRGVEDQQTHMSVGRHPRTDMSKPDVACQDQSVSYVPEAGV
jgi:hypothetical protein